MTDSHSQPPEDLHLHFTDLGKATLVPPKWVVKDLIPTGMTFLYSPPKSYKSTLELAIALLTANIPCQVLPPQFAGPDKPGLVLGFSYEATAGELRYMAEENMGVVIPADGSILIADDPWAFRLDDPEQVRKLLYWADEVKPRLLFIDPLRNFHSLDENDSGAIIKALSPLQRWAKDSDAACLIVHHTRKVERGLNTTATDMRGTSALFGMADGVIGVTRKADETVHLDCTFKRGASWNRTIQLSVYNRKGEASTEALKELDGHVLGLIKGGASGLSSIALQLKCAKSRVVAACAVLERNRLIKKDKKGKWVPT